MHPILNTYMNKFEQLGLNESLLKAILDLGFENPSEVQEKATISHRGLATKQLLDFLKK